jgi:integrase
MSDALRKKKVKINPVSETEPFQSKHKKRDPLTKEEAEKVFPEDQAKLLAIWGKLYWVSFFLISYTCGARPSEVRALFPCHIQEVPKKGTALAIVQAAKDDGSIGPTKSGDTRAVWIADNVAAILRDYIKTAGIDSVNELLFPSPKDDKKPVSIKTIERHFYMGLTNAKIEIGDRNIVPYSLRHTFVTLRRAFYGQEMFKYMIGHKNSKTTDQFYDHPDPVQRLTEYGSFTE